MQRTLERCPSHGGYNEPIQGGSCIANIHYPESSTETSQSMSDNPYAWCYQ
jgi:hypothetical protein